MQDWGGRIGEARHQFRRGKLLGYAAAACLVLAGCDSIVASGPSEETAFLDREVIPQIVKWGSGTAENFHFSDVVEARGYDKVCLLDQYWSLHMIGKGFGPIDTYHSTFGNSVPENYVAVIAIRKSVAHAALLDSTKISLGAVPGKLCGNPAKTVLKREPRLHEWSTPSAILEPNL
jgi:hypothetical protein